MLSRYAVACMIAIIAATETVAGEQEAQLATLAKARAALTSLYQADDTDARLKQTAVEIRKQLEDVQVAFEPLVELQPQQADRGCVQVDGLKESVVGADLDESEASRANVLLEQVVVANELRNCYGAIAGAGGILDIISTSKAAKLSKKTKELSETIEAETTEYRSGAFRCRSELEMCRSEFGWLDCELTMIVCLVDVVLN